jgi:hypothetical protein
MLCAEKRKVEIEVVKENFMHSTNRELFVVCSDYLEQKHPIVPYKYERIIRNIQS